jgi:hypothetical protein
LTCLGYAPKHVAGELEIARSTVASHLGRICRRAHISRAELVIYVLQNPEILQRGGKCNSGLHPRGCSCDSPYCKGIRVRRAA